MSFSTETKAELCRSSLKNTDILHSEMYGMLLFARRFTSAEISFRTDSEDAAKRFVSVAARCVYPAVKINTELTVRKNDTCAYKLFVPDKDDCSRVFELFGHDDGAPCLRINRGNMENESCMASFLRGAFLTCGSIAAPAKEYRLEFVVQHRKLSEDLCRITAEATDYIGGREITPRVMVRRGLYVVYFKDSDDIADMLTLMGAPIAGMNVLQARIIKSYNNTENRKVNSEVANTDKSLTAAAKQISAIHRLESMGKLPLLSNELREEASIRTQYPQATMKELGEMCDPPLSKSGVSHRLGKLIELAGKTEDDV